MAQNYRAFYGNIALTDSPVIIDVGSSIGVTRRTKFKNRGTAQLLISISETDTTDFGDNVPLDPNDKDETFLNVKFIRITLVGIVTGSYLVTIEGT